MDIPSKHWREKLARNIIIICDFAMQMSYPIPNIMPDITLMNKKKGTCHRVDFSVSADHRVQMRIFGSGKSAEHERAVCR